MEKKFEKKTAGKKRIEKSSKKVEKSAVQQATQENQSSSEDKVCST